MILLVDSVVHIKERPIEDKLNNGVTVSVTSNGTEWTKKQHVAVQPRPFVKGMYSSLKHKPVNLYLTLATLCLRFHQ